MNKLQEEFKHFCNQKQDTILVHPKEILDWINQNYISKQQILNLECLKEENYPEGQWKQYPLQARNQLRNEIKKEIEKL